MAESTSMQYCLIADSWSMQCCSSWSFHSISLARHRCSNSAFAALTHNTIKHCHELPAESLYQHEHTDVGSMQSRCTLSELCSPNTCNKQITYTGAVKVAPSCRVHNLAFDHLISFSSQHKCLRPWYTTCLQQAYAFMHGASSHVERS